MSWAPPPPPPLSGTPQFVYRPRLRIITFGDSLTEKGVAVGGWVSMVANTYQRRADVLNRGYSGYNSRNAVALLHHHEINGIWPANGNRTLTFVFFGANDAALPTSSAARQHVPVDVYRRHLTSIVRRLSSSSSSVVLITPPQVDSVRWSVHQQQRYSLPAPEMTRDNAVTASYAAAVREVGGTLSVPVVDLYYLTAANADGEFQCLSDGLHLSALGNEVLYRAVMTVINDISTPRSDDDKAHFDYRPEFVPLDGPIWSDIDPNDVDRSFALSN